MIRFLLLVSVFVAQAVPAQLTALDSPAGDHSLAPGMATLPDGAVVLTWLQKIESGHVLKFSRYANGRFGPAREIARGGEWFANWADTPGLHVLPNGDWIVHWLEKSGPGTFSYDIRVVRSADGGRTWTDPVSPHRDGTPTEHGFVGYFNWSDSDAGLVWLDGRETASDAGGAAHGHHEHAGDMTLRTAALGPDGSISREALLDSRVCDCCQTAAGITDSGPVIAYRDRGPGEIRDISMVRWLGEGWSDPRTVHEDGWEIGGCPVNGPALIARGREVIVAWFTMPGGVPRVRLARSADAAASFSAPQEFSTGSALGRVALGWFRSGYLLMWLDQSDNGARLQLAYFESGTEPAWERTLAMLDAGRISGFPQLARSGAGRIVVAWTASENRVPQVKVAEIDLESDLSH